MKSVSSLTLINSPLLLSRFYYYIRYLINGDLFDLQVFDNEFCSVFLKIGFPQFMEIPGTFYIKRKSFGSTLVKTK
jgi:hypothetical protein